MLLGSLIREKLVENLQNVLHIEYECGIIRCISIYIVARG